MLSKEGLERKNVVISAVPSQEALSKMSFECHVRISFELMAMCSLSTDCNFNETGVGGRIK